MEALWDEAESPDLVESSLWLSGTGGILSFRGVSESGPSFKEQGLILPTMVAFLLTSLLPNFVMLSTPSSYARGGNKVPAIRQLILWGLSVWSGGRHR